jgi:hypothetical protein
MLVVIQLGVIGAIAIYIFARQWTTRVLQTFQVWLYARSPTVTSWHGL